MNNRATIDAKAFSEGLDQVSRTLKKTAIPILSEVLVRIHSGQCTLTATDLETWLVRRLPAQGDDLSFVFRNTRDVVKACRLFCGDLELELTTIGEGNTRALRLLMRCGNRSCEFDAMLPDDYPCYSAFEADTLFSVNAGILMDRIGRVSYAARRPNINSNQPTITSIQMSGNHVYALDGRRLSCDTDQSFLFPRSFMAHAEPLSYLKLFDSKEIMVELSERRGRFVNDTLTVEFRITGTECYRLESGIPRGVKEVFSIAPKAFLRELKYLKQFAGHGNTPYVRFHGGELVMPVTSGKYRTRVEIAGKNEIMFAFDPNLMMDALQQFKGTPAIRLNITSSSAPILIDAEGRNDFAMVCPTRLTERLMAA